MIEGDVLLVDVIESRPISEFWDGWVGVIRRGRYSHMQLYPPPTIPRVTITAGTYTRAPTRSLVTLFIVTYVIITIKKKITACILLQAVY